MATLETPRLVLAAAVACQAKKAEDIRILELDPLDAGFTDYFLISSAANDRQAVAIADEVEAVLKREHGMSPLSVEGRRVGEWILIDYLDFVVHVFLAEKRAYYDIERLRTSARVLDVDQLQARLAQGSKRRAASGKVTTAKETPVKTAVKTAAKTAAKRKAGTQTKSPRASRPAGKPPAAKKPASLRPTAGSARPRTQK